MNNGKSIDVEQVCTGYDYVTDPDCRNCEACDGLRCHNEPYVPPYNVVMEGNSMRLGPFRGYYGRAAWNDATERFEGWLICPDRVKFHSVKERNIALNFERAVNEYLEEEEELCC